MSLFKELGRRNVVRVGIAYLIASWVIAQVADLVLENIGAPVWVMQSILLVIALGFPVALIFSWCFEVTPEGIKRESEVDRSKSITPVTGRRLDRAIIVLLVIAVAYFAYQSRQSGNAPDTTGPGSMSVAVLPFDNRSNREEDQFFTEGMHDDLLTTLAKIGSLKVISRTSVMEYANTTKKIPEIAAELGVSKVLEGGVQRSGDMVRINVQLIEAQTDEHLWAEIYDRELTAENLFAIQTEVSRAIADALHATLTPADEKRISTVATTNLEAYDAYWRGRQHSDTREAVRLEQAAEYFRQATEIDPEFALAWVGLADTYYFLSSYGSMRSAQTFDIRQQAIDNALAINPELGEAYASLGMLRRSQNRNEEAEAAFLRAIELSPNYATGYHWYSLFLSDSRSRIREAVELGRKAAELSPRSSAVGTNLAQVYDFLGDEESALEIIDQVLNQDPGFAYAHVVKARAALGAGRHDLVIDAARRAVELDPGSPFPHIFLIWRLLDINAVEEARSAFADLRAELPNHFMLRAANLSIQTHVGNETAVRQLIAPLMDARAGTLSWNMSIYALVSIGELEAARELLDKDSRLNDETYIRDQSIEEPDDVCGMAWLLQATGDNERARQLLDIAIPVIEEELPRYVDDAFKRGEVCYLAAGDNEAAIEKLQLLAERRVIINAAMFKSPVHAAIRDDPRIQAIISDLTARQAQIRQSLGYE